jgi:hypothetical protein
MALMRSIGAVRDWTAGWYTMKPLSGREMIPGFQFSAHLGDWSACAAYRLGAQRVQRSVLSRRVLPAWAPTRMAAAQGRFADRDCHAEDHVQRVESLRP